MWMLAWHRSRNSLVDRCPNRELAKRPDEAEAHCTASTARETTAESCMAWREEHAVDDTTQPRTSMRGVRTFPTAWAVETTGRHD
jgi:hypothetical protein